MLLVQIEVKKMLGHWKVCTPNCPVECPWTATLVFLWSLKLMMQWSFHHSRHHGGLW